MKICSACGLEKDLADYYQRKLGPRGGEYYNHCKNCLRIRGRRYYDENRGRQAGLANKRRREYRESRKEFVTQLKDKPCVDCGQKYPPYVMDFDHRMGETKRGSIANLVNQNFLTYSEILAEVTKCDLVCANCHRIRTFTRLSIVEVPAIKLT